MIVSRGFEMTACSTYSATTNLLPSQLAASSSRNNDLTLAVEAHDLHANRASATTLDLMFVAEEIYACLTTTIIEPALNENPKHSTLASIDIAHNGNACLDHFVYVLGTMSYNHLTAEARILYVSGANLDVASNIPGHQNLIIGLDQLADSLQSLDSKVPFLLRKSHGLAGILEPEIKQNLAMALGKTPLNVLAERGYILLGRINE
jgi:hypothetical protein